MSLTSKQILAEKRYSLLRVDLPEWAPLGVAPDDSYVYVRSMSGREKREISTVINDSNGVEFPDSGERLVAAYCCDEDGKPLFTADDLAHLSDADRKLIERIAMAALRHNGLVKDALEQAEKNSAPTPSESSSTD